METWRTVVPSRTKVLEVLPYLLNLKVLSDDIIGVSKWVRGIGNRDHAHHSHHSHPSRTSWPDLIGQTCLVSNMAHVLGLVPHAGACVVRRASRVVASCIVRSSFPCDLHRIGVLNR